MRDEVKRVLEAVVNQEPAFTAKTRMGDFVTQQMEDEKWEHRDFPRMSEATWKTILKLVEGRYTSLTGARYASGEVRGQLLIAPDAIQVLRERVAGIS